MVIRDDLLLAPLLESIAKGAIPTYNFQGLAEKPDGQQERIAFNNAVPNGTFGIQNLTPGEVVEREMNFSLNQIPQLIQQIAATYEYAG